VSDTAAAASGARDQTPSLSITAPTNMHQLALQRLHVPLHLQHLCHQPGLISSSLLIISTTTISA
jgi:hypothetical protein